MLPPRIVLAAVDFSPGSRAALSFAARLATHCAAELHVLHAVPSSLVRAAQAAGHDVRAEMLEELHRVLAETAPSVEAAARCHVIEGEVANVILDIAARERADVVVIGEKGLSNEEWPALGSTLEDVLRRTTISVIVVPVAWHPPNNDRTDLVGAGPIIAGVDMTCPAIEAASAACRLAQPLQTRVLMLHAVPPPQTLAPWQAYATAAASTEFEQSRVDFERVASAVQDKSPVPVTFATERGDIADVLAQQARRQPYGIVVLGRASCPHSYGPPGSIVARTLLLGRVPVLMHIGGVRS